MMHCYQMVTQTQDGVSYMIDDAGQEIEFGMGYRLLEEKQDLLTEVKRLRIIEDRYNSIEQMHTEGFCKYNFESDGVEGCWFCEEERLEREEG